jgi:hypothetical protein
MSSNVQKHIRHAGRITPNRKAERKLQKRLREIIKEVNT